MQYPYKHSLPIFNEHTYRLVIDGNQVPTLTDLYQLLSSRLEFPDYFNGNLDGLYDCLTDLSQFTDRFLAVALVIYHAEQILVLESAERKKAVFEVLEAAQNAENRYDNLRFQVYLLHD